MEDLKMLPLSGLLRLISKDDYRWIEFDLSQWYAVTIKDHPVMGKWDGMTYRPELTSGKVGD